MPDFGLNQLDVERVEVTADVNELPLIEQLDVGRRIGKGQFGTVYEAIHKVSGVRYAVKVSNNRDSKAMFKNEIQMLRSIQHVFCPDCCGLTWSLC